MTATKNDIREWFDEGIKKGATHMIVMCDSFDYENYCVYVMPGQNAKEMARLKTGNMQRVEECYSLSMDKESQIKERRVYNYD